MDDKRINLLKNEKISKAVNAMAAPAILGMLVMAVYNVVDSIFVSWLGSAEIAATQVVLPIMLIASAIGLAFGMGGGSYISRLLGSNKGKEANKVASVSFFTGLIVGLVVIIANLIFLEPVLNFFGANDSTLELAKEYGRFIIVGYVFTILNMVMNNSLRSEGSSKYSMIGMAFGSILNIVLDPILIFVFDLGIEGAAIATTISQAASTLLLLSFYIRKKSIVKIGIQYFKPSVAIYKEILIVGIPTFFRQILMSISIGLLNSATQIAGNLDTEFLAAISIVIRVTMIPNYIIFGYGQGFQPVAGYNYGAKNKERVMGAFKYSLKIQTYIMIGSLILLNVFGGLIFTIYQSSEVVTDFGLSTLRWYTIGMLFLGVSNTISVFYQALGRGTEALILSVSRQGLFFIPFILFLPRVFGVDGVMMAQTASDLFTLILSISFMIPFITNKKIDLLMAE